MVADLFQLSKFHYSQEGDQVFQPGFNVPDSSGYMNLYCSLADIQQFGNLFMT